MRDKGLFQQHKYYYNKDTGYVQRQGAFKNETAYLHTDIQPCNIPGMQVDHKDHNKLNNKRTNLRVLTAQQNCLCRGFRKGSLVIGVYRTKNNKYIARFQNKHLGTYKTMKEAALTFNEAILKVFNESTVNNIELIELLTMNPFSEDESVLSSSSESSDS